MAMVSPEDTKFSASDGLRDDLRVAEVCSAEGWRAHHPMAGGAAAGVSGKQHQAVTLRLQEDVLLAVSPDLGVA
ncbi:hypothetical protein E2C01_000048 [Portunus trituberculatus]|uniref:Uncharacterized protein n=1 Tax=Portunus trituberculatus TaxID=210409 RepID=A0A5B7CG93_PORTR|nr:hypothetical protein [Portunus trituberculatus]